MNDVPDSQDKSSPELKQRAARKRAFKGAYAIFNNEFSEVPCTLRDESEVGAKLKFENGWWIPDRFTLFVELDGYKVECEKVWHKGSVYGVRFIGPKELIAAPRRQKVDFSSIHASDPILRAVKPDEDTEDPPEAIVHKHHPAFGKLGKED